MTSWMRCKCGETSGSGNALVGGYLKELGFGYDTKSGAAHGAPIAAWKRTLENRRFVPIGDIRIAAKSPLNHQRPFK